MKKAIDPKVKKMTKEEKLKLLKIEVALMNKKYKREVISFGTDKEIQRIPFKNKELNDITSGGVPSGRFSVIWGAKGSGKTTICYDLVKTAQGMDKLCAWVDLERSFEPTWAKTMGVNVEELLIAPKFETAEEAMDFIIMLGKKKVIDLIIVDSIQGLSPKGEQETKKGVVKSLEDDTIALLARKLSQFFRMSAAGIAESDCTVVMIGQTRMDLGGFITLEKLSGGNALEHWSSLTVHIRRGKKADAPAVSSKTGKPVKASNDDAQILGFDIVAKVNKSKVGPDENRTCHVPFYYGKGMLSNCN